MKLLRFVLKHKWFLLVLFFASMLLTLEAAARYDNFNFKADAPFWKFCNAIFIFALLHKINRKSTATSEGSIIPINYLIKFIVGLLFYLIIVNLFGFLISLGFNNLSRNYASIHQITYSTFRQIIDFTLFGSIVTAYFFLNDYRSTYSQIISSQKQINLQKIAQLQSQMNPHFLFNNLNTLDQLIWENREKASLFLESFAGTFRFMIQNSNHDLIGIDSEITFSKMYFDIIKEKYGDNYFLEIDPQITELPLKTPPFSIQTLIENVIDHNPCNSDKKVIISIGLQNGIAVRNNKSGLPANKKGNGIALKNLDDQFKILCGKGIKINEDSNYFCVTLPMVKNKLT